MLYFPIKEFSQRYGGKFFSFEITTFTIKRGENKCLCLLTEFIVYHLHIFLGQKHWVIEKRFSDFEKVLVHFIESYPNMIAKLPKLPTKTYFNVLHDKIFLEKRKEKLTIFLHEFLLQATVNKVLSDFVLIDFLEFNKNNPDLT